MINLESDQRISLKIKYDEHSTTTMINSETQTNLISTKFVKKNNISLKRLKETISLITIDESSIKNKAIKFKTKNLILQIEAKKTMKKFLMTNISKSMYLENL